MVASLTKASKIPAETKPHQGDKSNETIHQLDSWARLIMELQLLELKDGVSQLARAVKASHNTTVNEVRSQKAVEEQARLERTRVAFCKLLKEEKMPNLRFKLSRLLLHLGLGKLIMCKVRVDGVDFRILKSIKPTYSNNHIPSKVKGAEMDLQ